MNTLIENIKSKIILNKWMLGLIFFVICLILYLYILTRIRVKYSLTQYLGDHLESRLIEAGVPLQIPIEGEGVYTDTLLLRFYADLSFQPAWINNKGPIATADSLIEAIQLAKHEGLESDHYHLKTIRTLLDSVRAHKKNKIPFDIQLLSDLELLLTDAFLLYGSHLLSGHIDPETIDPAWMNRYQESDMTETLNQALDEKRIQRVLFNLLPSFYHYGLLRDELGRYKSVAWRGGWPIIPVGPTIQMGDEGYRVAALRARLMTTGDFQPETIGENPIYDSTLVEVVRRFQKRHHLNENGTVDYPTRRIMNQPALHYVRILSANMERWRWLPRDLGDRYILVNIAAFEMQVVEFGETVLKMPVVVGKDYRQTPVFSGNMNHLVFNPYWNVPSTIARKDILPKVKADPNYLTSRNFEVFPGWSSNTPINPDSIDWVSLTQDSLPYRFRQDPGKLNSLGRIKFIFPNKYDVYLHDTPDRIHFKRRERAYSSGCIRLEDPVALAEYVLRGNPEWNLNKIQSVLESLENKTVKLDEPIPVYIFYCTTWADEDGTIHYLRDIYERDVILENAMRREAFLPY